MLYRLSMNCFVLRRLKSLIKGHRVLLNRKRRVTVSKKKVKKKKFTLNTNISCNQLINKNAFPLINQMDESLISFKRYYFKLLLTTFLVDKNKLSFCWGSFIENLYNEFTLFSILSETKSHYFTFLKDIHSIGSLNDLFFDYDTFTYCDHSLNRFAYYSDVIINGSYDLPFQSYDWMTSSFSSLKEYKRSSLYLILFILFISNLFYFKSTLLYSKKHCFHSLKRFNKKIYKTPYFLKKKRTFFGCLEYKTDIFNIMFNDLLLLEYSRIWSGHYCSLFLKYYSNYEKCLSIHLFSLFIFFFDLEYTQFWLYKLFEDKAIGFYGYGDVFALFKFKYKTELISSPSLHSLG